MKDQLLNQCELTESEIEVLTLYQEVTATAATSYEKMVTNDEDQVQKQTTACEL